MSAQLTGAEVLAALSGHVAGGTLRLGTGALGAPVDAALTAYFGGTLVATVGTPEVGANDVRYSAASLATPGFALYAAKPAVTADITVSSDATGTFQLAVVATMPAGYALADSFPVVAQAPAPALAALTLSGASYGIDSTAPAGTVAATLVPDPAGDVLAAVDWLLPSGPALTGPLVLTTVGTATYPELTLVSGTATAAVGTLSLTANAAVTTRVVRAADGTVQAFGVMVELVADLVAGSLTIPVAVDLWPGQTKVSVRLDPRRPTPPLDSLSALTPLAAGASPQALLSTDTPIGTLSLESVGFSVDLATRAVTDLHVSVGLGTHWPIVPGAFELDGLGVVVTVPNLYQPSAVAVTGTAYLVVGTGLVDAYVVYPDKVVGVTLQPGTQIDLTTLLSKMAGGAQLPGNGTFAVIALDAYADIAAKSYSLTVAVGGTLAVVPGFELDELYLAVEYGGGTLQMLGFGSVFTVAGAQLALSAAYAGGSWTIEGGTYQDSTIDLVALGAELAAPFGVTLPPGLPAISLSGLHLSYATGTGAYAFTGSIGYFDPDALLKRISGTVTIESAGTGKAWTGSAAGQAVIGTSAFAVTYAFAAAQVVTFTWSLTPGAAPFGIAALCEAVGAAPPAIPEGLDLGLDQASFSYRRDTGAVLLSAHSVHYGYALFQREPVAGAPVYAFGVDVPLNLTLADIPLVGDSLPGAHQLGIADLGVWLVSRPLLKAEAEQLNAANTQTGYPRLPDADVPSTVTFFGNLVLGSATVPIVLPVGAPTATPPGTTTPGTTPAATPPPGTTPPGTTPPDTTPAATPGAAPAPAPPADGTRWFAVERTFGVFTFHRIGVAYVTDGSNALFVVLDASVALGPVTLTMLGLAVGSPLTAFVPAFRLRGLGLSYDAPPLTIEGALYALPADQLAAGTSYQYDGVAVVTAGQLTLAAIGSYARLDDGEPSLFLFAQLRAPLGGPPAFFVVGLMGGFGVNRSLTLPAQDEVLGFPLLALAAPPAPGQPAAAADPAQVLGMLEGTVASPGGQKHAWIAPRSGEYWLALGVEFTSFELVDTRALLVAEFGTDFALALLGLSTMRLPQGAPDAETYAYVELELEAVLRPSQGFFGLSAVLSPSSYVIAPAAKLTGGFAFYVWFGPSTNAGQFVVTLGGYHPAFSPPSYFPAEPRLGFAWAVSDTVSIKGSAYFALTTSCVMAGGGLEIVYASGALRAWFTAQADLLVSWHPFSFLASIDVSIGVSYRLDVLGVSKTLSASIGASLELWGPPTGGTVTVHLYFVSFTVSFGSSRTSLANDPLTPAQVAALLPDRLCTVTATGGLTAAVDDPAAAGQQRWLVRAGAFSFTTESAVPATTLAYGGTTATAATSAATGFALHVRPMDLTSTTATHTVRLQRGDGTWVDLTTWSPAPLPRPLPASLWGAPLTDSAGRFTQLPAPSADVVPAAPVGAAFTAPAPALGATPGLVELVTLAYEPVSPPGQPGVDGEAPLDTSVTETTGYLPTFSETSVGAVAGIGAAPGRTALYTALAGADLFTGADDPMTAFAAAAADLFSDPPMLAGAAAGTP